MTAIPNIILPESVGVSKPPTGFDRVFDTLMRGLAWSFAAGTILLLGFVVYEIGFSAVPAVRKHGLSLITSSVYDLNAEHFGLRAPILGTLYSSVIALIIATTFGVSIAIFLSQSFIPRRLELVFKNIVELLAAIPSVVYGLWGYFVLIPLLRPAINSVSRLLGGHFPLLNGELANVGMLPAALVLSIMVLPTISAISYDALVSVNPRIKEAAFGLGATRWEAILKVILPTASTGIFGSVILGFGRALGETMALALLLGNSNHFSFSLLAQGNTLAALIANTFPEAAANEKQVLLFAGLVLLGITLIVNVIGSLIIQFANRGRGGARQ